MTTVSVSKETRDNLKKLVVALQKVAGRKFTYDDAVNFLLDCFNNYADLLAEKHRWKQSLSLFEAKMKFVEEFYDNKNCILYEKVGNFFYLPDAVKKQLDEKAAEKKKSPQIFLIDALLKGIEVADKTYFVLGDDLNKRLSDVLLKFPEDKRKKAEKELEKTFETVFKQKIVQLEKKLEKSGRKK